MIAEAVASAELAQPAWTYPICARCEAPILTEFAAYPRDGAWCHLGTCPDVEDLDSLPLVERAAIACSMVACGRQGPVHSDRLSYALDILGEDIAGPVDWLILEARKQTYFEADLNCWMRLALAESMLRNGEIR